MDTRAQVLIAAVVDLALVGLFVVIGRASHREDQSAFLVTFWPFAVGLALGWGAARVWRAPFGIVRAGVLAWLATVVIGMLLRAASGQGVQVAFVVVATIVVGAFLVGWRVLLVAADRSASRSPDLPGPIPLPRRRR